MKLTNLMLFVILITSKSLAAIPCDNSILKTQETHVLPGAGYWMQAFGDCRLTYTSVGGVSSQMYNLCTRKSETITNRIDAYGLPEGDIYTHPHSSKGFRFFKFSDLMKDGKEARPFYTDEAHVGNYQSIGILSQSEKERVIRVAMGNQSGTFQDYKITKNSDEDINVSPLRPTAQKVCKNIPSAGLDSQLPVLSRNGKYIAGRDNGTRVMKIYEINPENGECKLVNEIPKVTSKVSFSFNHEDVYYVVSDPAMKTGRLEKMNIKSGKISTVSIPTENVQYMTLKANGELLYTRDGEGTSDSSTLIKLKESELVTSKNQMAHELIGLKWAKNCQLKLDLDYAASIGMRMKSEVCQEVIALSDMRGIDDSYKKVSAEKLKEACQSNSTAQTNVQEGQK